MRFLRARYFDSGTGRFLTKDPFTGFLAAPSLSNRYVYVMNNPTGFVDPSGYFPSLSGVTSFFTSGLEAVETATDIKKVVDLINQAVQASEANSQCMSNIGTTCNNPGQVEQNYVQSTTKLTGETVYQGFNITLIEFSPFVNGLEALPAAADALLSQIKALLSTIPSAFAPIPTAQASSK